MPRLRNGMGSMFLGSNNQYPDRSFVTTEWLVILIPIIPVRSMRVAYFGTSHGLFRTTKEYIEIEKPSLDWQQVFTIYFLLIATFFISIQCTKLFLNFFDEYGGGLLCQQSLDLQFLFL